MREPSIWKGVGVLLVVLLSLSSSFSFSVDPRLSELLYLRKRGPVVYLTDATYSKFVASPSRPYNSVVLLSVGPSISCEHCHSLKKSVERVAKEYEEAGLMSPLSSGEASERLPTFFMFIDLLKHKNVVRMHSITGVPILIYLTSSYDISAIIGSPVPPQTSANQQQAVSNLPEDIQLHSVGLREQLDLVVLDWVNQRTGHKVYFTVSMKEKIIKGAMIGTIFILFSLIVRRLVLLSRNRPEVLGLGALFVQGLACSGLCWSVINGLHFSGVDKRTGQTIYFAPGRRSQFVGEGLMMSFSCVLCGMSFYGAGYVMKYNSMKSRRLSALVSLILGGLGFVLYRIVLDFHTAKSGLGAAPFLPPASAARGALLNDRGNSI